MCAAAVLLDDPLVYGACLPVATLILRVAPDVQLRLRGPWTVREPLDVLPEGILALLLAGVWVMGGVVPPAVAQIIKERKLFNYGAAKQEVQPLTAPA
mgnify:CR=1 FL=1